eukprot:188069_1
MALITRTKCCHLSLIIHNYPCITQIQHITYHHKYTLSTNLKSKRGNHYFHILKSRMQFTLKQIEELQYKQQNGHTLNKDQLTKISRKPDLQHKLQQIRDGTFKLNEHINTETHDNKPTQHRKTPPVHSSSITDKSTKNTNEKHIKNPTKCNYKSRYKSYQLNRYQLHNIIKYDKDELDLNEKFEKLLSRPNYSIWAVRELFANLNSTEWDQVPNEHIRHILDGYYMRNDIIFVYKILMKWFKKKMGNRYILYSDLCKTAIKQNNLQIAIEVFEYLLFSLMTKTNKYDDQNDINLLLYYIYDNMNLLIPKLIKDGQFYTFDDIV